MQKEQHTTRGLVTNLDRKPLNNRLGTGLGTEQTEMANALHIRHLVAGEGLEPTTYGL